MAFCTFCGKQLADGEVCTCQQAAEQQAAASEAAFTKGMQYEAPKAESQNAVAVGGGFKAFGKLLVKSFTRPFEASEAFFENADITASAVTLGVLTLLYAFVGLFTVLFYYAHVGAFGRYSLYYVEGKYFVQNFFFPILYMIIMTGATFGLGCMVNAVFIKGKFNPKKIFAFAASVSVPLMVCCVLYFLERSVSNYTTYGNLLFVIVRHAAAFVTVLLGLMHLKKLIDSRYKFLAATAICIAGLCLVSYIFASVFSRADGLFFTLPM